LRKRSRERQRQQQGEQVAHGIKVNQFAGRTQVTD
jgi:hypothetical protein